MAGSTQASFFVTGAAGQFGRRLTELLLDARVGTVVAGTRSPARIADKLLIVSRRARDAIAYVTREDTARAAAGALMRKPSNIRYDITGPLALTQDEVSAIVAAAYKKPIVPVHVTDEQLLAGLLAAGVPDVMARLSVEFDQNTRKGKLATVTDAVEQLTGQPSRALASWLSAEAKRLPDQGRPAYIAPRRVVSVRGITNACR